MDKPTNTLYQFRAHVHLIQHPALRIVQQHTSRENYQNKRSMYPTSLICSSSLQQSTAP